MRGERLKELRGAHRFAKTVDAARMILRIQEVDPLMNIEAFQQSVGSEFAAADAMSASVGKEHGEPVGQQELSVSRHADAVVTEAVEEEDSITVFLSRMDFPCAKCCAIGDGDGDVG